MVDVYLNWLHWLHFLILEGGLLVILIDFMIFLPPFQDVLRMSISIIFYNSLPIECFPLTYDQNGSKFRINRHLLTIGLSKRISCTIFNFFFFSVREVNPN